MKHIIITFSIILLSLTAQAQKTAFINETKLLEATPGYKEALASTEEVKKNYSQEIKDAQDKLQAKAIDLVKNYKVDKNTTKEQLEALLSEKDKANYALLKEENELLEKQIALKEKDYNAIYQDKVGTIITNLNQIIQTYCKQNKIEILYKKDALANGLAFVEDKLDITDAVLAFIKK